MTDVNRVPDKLAVEPIDPADTVSMDLGITKFIRDSTGRAVVPLDEEQSYRRIEKRHREASL